MMVLLSSMGFDLWKLCFVVVVMLLFQGLCSCSEEGLKYRYLRQATSAPQVSYYDYIIIGGGTAGCPLAATLSRNANVLLLERGGSPYGNPNITDLSTYPNVLADHSPSSPSQRFVSEDGVINARARVLGGGSCINAGFYSRAAAEEIRAAGWDEKLVNDSYKWVEKVVAFKPIVESWQSALREGLLEAGVTLDNGFTYDHLIGTKTGGTIFDRQGRRHTAADLLKYADPRRLTVLLHASVDKILFRVEGQVPRAQGVVFRDASGNPHEAYLNQGSKNEIVLSAGALGSTQLLMLSGVGPFDHLKSLNIDLVLDQPLVGQGMSDNPTNGIVVPAPKLVEVSSVQVVGITSFGSYIEACNGIDILSVLSGNDFQMFNPKRTSDSPKPPYFQGGFIFEKVTGPLSKGYLQLQSTDPADNPSVTFNYFADPQDLEKCVRGVKVIESVIESEAFTPFKYDNLSIPMLLELMASLPINLRPKHANTSTSLEQFCNDTVITLWHYHGGCQVGKVVDSEYRVIGVEALRVVDGSTFNTSPGTNPQATVMMLGRYMGVKILQERLKSLKSRDSSTSHHLCCDAQSQN